MHDLNILFLILFCHYGRVFPYILTSVRRNNEERWEKVYNLLWHLFINLAPLTKYPSQIQIIKCRSDTSLCRGLYNVWNMRESFLYKINLGFLRESFLYKIKCIFLPHCKHVFLMSFNKTKFLYFCKFSFGVSLSHISLMPSLQWWSYSIGSRIGVTSLSCPPFNDGPIQLDLG